MSHIGILALQGNFEAHRTRLSELGARSILVRTAEQLDAVSGLVIPGGESTTLLKLADEALREKIRQVAASGMPILATCAGVILLAKQVSNPLQESLSVLDIDVKRNAYGRQIDSFIDPNLSWTEFGKEQLRTIENSSCDPVEGVFIRAPIITRVGESLEVLIKRDPEPVLIRQNNIIAATFHPELSANALRVHQLFLSSLA